MSQNNKGFTLVEMLVVVLIISMLAAFIAPRFIGGLSEAKTKIARSKMTIIEDALGRFYLDCDRLPTQSEGLDALITAPPGLTDKWKTPYLKKSDLLDPWGNPYEYRAVGTENLGSFDLISYGADGVQGGEGENEDIVND
jgi:general secretion pathway protein G